MVGLVIVSHSRMLAEAASRLAQGVGKEDLPITFAGGTGDDFEDFGTDATDIMEAVQRVDSGDGVVILMDLGSAILSARLAEQMLGDDVPGIHLCPAPLVEGAVAAAVQIEIGANIEAVCREARGALKAKIEDMSDGEDGTTESCEELPDADSIPNSAILFRFTMDDPNGMHTRPAAELVKAVGAFHAEIRIRNAVSENKFVNARSLNQIALANIRKGDIAEVAVWGEDRDRVISALRDLVIGVYKGREVTEAEIPTKGVMNQIPQREVHAPPVLARMSSGVAVGVLFIDSDDVDTLPRLTVSDVEAEEKRLDKAVTEVYRAMDAQREKFGTGMENEAAILSAQRLILEDTEILDDVKKSIRAESCDAASAYQRRMNALAESYRSLDDAYMRERAVDVAGVSAQVLKVLLGRVSEDTSHLDNVIVWASEISPAHIARWQPGQLAAILTHEGGTTSHVAILAKAMGIPAVMGYVPPPGAKTGQRVGVDANRLEIVVEPDQAQNDDFVKRRDAWVESVQRDLDDSHGAAVTRDGVAVPVWANVGDVASVESAVKNNAEGIGLLRTEFLFLDRYTAPSEEEQMRELCTLIQPFASLPVTVRTLDAGADKPMPWLSMPKETNPFLGVRGIRLMMAHPDVFRTQLRAILRAGAEAGVKHLQVMIPMIATAEEIEFSRKALNDVHAELEKEGLNHSWPVRFGIMVETPAAVLQTSMFAGMIDFISIGTNDLAQYIMCAERGSQSLVRLSDSLHPAVLSAIKTVVDGAKIHDTEVAVCGEMAGDPVSALALLGIGVGHLSMSAPAIGPVKRAIRSVESSVMQASVTDALGKKSADEVAVIFRAFMT